MSQVEITILDKLTEYGGDVSKVADELALSHSWVSRVKKNKWTPAQTLDLGDNFKSPAVRQADVVNAILPPNINEVQTLRDLTLGDLVDRITRRELTATESIRMLKVLLEYELSLRSVLQPAVNVFQDNRQNNVQVNNLVDRLAELHPDVLRSLSEGEIIDG